LKIKIKENIAGLNFSYSIGEVVEVKKELADDLIKAEYAEEVKSKRNTNKSGDK